jgi:hypothetical protein
MFDIINIDNVYVSGSVNNATGVVGAFPPGSVPNYTYMATFNGSVNFFEFNISAQLTRGRYLVTILPAPASNYQELSLNTTIFYNGSDTVSGGGSLYIDSGNYLTLRTKSGAKSTFLTITNITTPSPTVQNSVVLFVNFWKVS